MINQNSKTQIQARIDAANGATTLNDLLLLRKSAEGLCCNESNLDTLITAALNAQDGTTPVKQLLAGRMAIGLRGHVMYQTPVAVKAGDELFIDALGKVKTEQYPMRGAVALTNVPVASGIEGDMSPAVKGYVMGGRLEAGSSNGGASAVLTLSDGNLLYLFGVRTNWLNQLSHASIIAPDETTVISTHELTPLVNGSDSSNNTQLVGVFEVSANVFRVFYTVSAAGSGGACAIRYVTLTYNTGTKALASAAGATVVTSSNASASYRTFAPHKQGERYTLVGTLSSAPQWCLDMQTSSVIAYTSTTTINQATEFDMSTPGAEYAYALIGTTPSLMRGGVDARLAIPANLTSDGSFGSTWRVHLIAPRMFMSLKAGSPVKLVRFSSDWLTATIYTMTEIVPSSVIAGPDGRALVLKSDNNRFFVKANTTEPMFSFVWDGLSAPVGADPSVGWLSTNPVAAYFRNRLPVLTPNDRVTYAMTSGQYVTDDSNNYTTNMMNYFTFDAAEMTGYTPAKIGLALNDAIANAFTELELSDGTSVFPTTTAPLRAEIVGRNNLRRILQRDRQSSLNTMYSYSSGATTTSNFASALSNAQRVSEIGVSGDYRQFAAGGALLTSARVNASFLATGSTNSGEASNSNLAVLAVEGSANPSDNTSAVSGLRSQVGAIIKTDKPVMISFGGRIGYVLWEREL